MKHETLKDLLGKHPVPQPPPINAMHWSGLPETETDRALNLEHFNLNGTCPNCQIGLFQEGPGGGMSSNVRCQHCGAEYCLSLPFEIARLDRDEPHLYTGFTLVLHDLPKGVLAFLKRWSLRRRIKARDLRKAADSLAK